MKESGLARSENIGSVRTLPARVWIRNVECPMKVTAAHASASSACDCCGTTGTDAGHGSRLAAIIRGAAEIGCPLAPVGLKKRPPSKCVLAGIVIDRRWRRCRARVPSGHHTGTSSPRVAAVDRRPRERSLRARHQRSTRAGTYVPLLEPTRDVYRARD